MAAGIPDVAGNRRSWERRLGQDEQPAGTLVFEQEPDGVIGLIHVSPSRDADVAGAAEVTAIYVLPDHSGRGRGQALTAAACVVPGMTLRRTVAQGG